MTSSIRHFDQLWRDRAGLPGVNRVTLVGIVGRDPEMRFTTSGDAVAAFRLMVARTWASAHGGRGNSVDWFNIIAWHQLAEASCQRLRKGSPVYIEGRLQQRTWIDDTGATQQRIEIVATEIAPLDDRPPNTSSRPGRRPGHVQRGNS